MASLKQETGVYLTWSPYACPSSYLLGRFTEGITFDGGLEAGRGESIGLLLPRDVGGILDITLGEARGERHISSTSPLVKREGNDTYPGFTKGDVEERASI